MAAEKWEIPRTVTALRGFLGFTNYYATYVPRYDELVADLEELWKVGRDDLKKREQKIQLYLDQYIVPHLSI